MAQGPPTQQTKERKYRRNKSGKDVFVATELEIDLKRHTASHNFSYRLLGRRGWGECACYLRDELNPPANPRGDAARSRETRGGQTPLPTLPAPGALGESPPHCRQGVGAASRASAASAGEICSLPREEAAAAAAQDR